MKIKKYHKTMLNVKSTENHMRLSNGIGGFDTRKAGTILLDLLVLECTRIYETSIELGRAEATRET